MIGGWGGEISTAHGSRWAVSIKVCDVEPLPKRARIESS